MTRLLRIATIGAGTTAGLLLALLSPTGPAPVSADPARAARASLKVTPAKVYVGGQALTFSGSIGARGRRAVHVEYQIQADSSDWYPVAGHRARTKPNGRFRFTFPAPAMTSIKLRVASGRLATPYHVFQPRAQDLTLTVPQVGGLGEDEVAVGRPFRIAVDTAPQFRSGVDTSPPVLPGRRVTLQVRRADLSWKSLAARKADKRGMATFNATINAPGEVTYRVRQENWTAGGNQIGWYPSFPVTVTAVSASSERAAAATPPSYPVRAGRGTPVARTSTATASKANQWGVSLWDFAWMFGEPLTTRPSRGTDLKGWWLDASDGEGRVMQLNGQLALDSQRNWTGPGDHGTTTATLQDNPMAYGRWETRLRLKPLERGAKNYTVRVEIIPDRAKDYRCGAQNITVAEIPVGGSTVGIGVRTRSGKQWTAKRHLRIGTAAASVGVEVTAKNVTWFFDGKPIGTLKKRVAPAIPRTLRLSLVGQGQQEMNHVQVFSDWQRGFSLDRGKPNLHGQRLKAGKFKRDC